MTMTQDNDGDSDRILDHLLGWTSPRQRRGMERRLEHDTKLRDSAEAWQETLAPLDRLGNPVTPPPEAWAEVLAQISREKPLRGLAWRWAALGGAGLVAAGIAAALILTPARPLYQAELKQSAAAPSLALVEADARNDVTITDIGLPQLPAGKSFELWIIPPGGAVRSLGVMHGKVETRHLDTLPPHTALAISVEPAGGSPTGVATGPVIVSGELKRL